MKFFSIVTTTTTILVLANAEAAATTRATTTSDMVADNSNSNDPVITITVQQETQRGNLRSSSSSGGGLGYQQQQDEEEGYSSNNNNNLRHLQQQERFLGFCGKGDVCHQDAICKQILRSRFYTCTCKDGFKGDGITCLPPVFPPPPSTLFPSSTPSSAPSYNPSSSSQQQPFVIDSFSNVNLNLEFEPEQTFDASCALKDLSSIHNGCTPVVEESGGDGSGSTISSRKFGFFDFVMPSDPIVDGEAEFCPTLSLTIDQGKLAMTSSNVQDYFLLYSYDDTVNCDFQNSKDVDLFDPSQGGTMDVLVFDVDKMNGFSMTLAVMAGVIDTFPEGVSSKGGFEKFEIPGFESPLRVCFPFDQALLNSNDNTNPFLSPIQELVVALSVTKGTELILNEIRTSTMHQEDCTFTYSK